MACSRAASAPAVSEEVCWPPWDADGSRLETRLGGTYTAPLMDGVDVMARFVPNSQGAYGLGGMGMDPMGMDPIGTDAMGTDAMPMDPIGPIGREESATKSPPVAWRLGMP